MELIVGRPTGSDVVRGYLEGDERACTFFGRHFESLDDFRSKAAEVDQRFDRAARERAVEALIVPPGADAARLDAFVEQGGYMVTTGQQPGLFGGPLYSVHKALTAVRLAEALQEALGKPVIPVFWVASEDHDWAEANHADVIGVDNELHRVELAAPDESVHPAIHRIPMGESIAAEVDAFLQALPNTDFSSDYFELIRSAFVPESTLADGFHTVLQQLLGRFGLFFTDAAHPALKEQSAQALLEELDRAEEMEGVLSGTAKALEGAGFSLQVPILEGGVNLFLDGPAGRERLYRDGEGFKQRTSQTAVSAEEVRERQAADPTVLSPNVLFRPVVESSVFPTLSYVGGPGEMAYFAQQKDYFAAHGIEMPVIFPRFSAAPVETKIRRVLDKFGLSPEDLHRPFHEVAGDIARDDVPPDVRKALGGLRGAIGKSVGELTQAVKAIDPTLKGTVQHVRSQSFAAIDDLEKKIVHALKRENEIALGQLEKAQVHLFPNGKPAERVQNPFYFLTRYGGAVLDRLYDAFSVNLS
jgi:bacillithiol synthase